MKIDKPSPNRYRVRIQQQNGDWVSAPSPSAPNEKLGLGELRPSAFPTAALAQSSSLTWKIYYFFHQAMDTAAELERDGRFHVHGSRGRRYCIRAQGQSGNVNLVDKFGVIQAKAVCSPSGLEGSVPDPDAWLAQMLALQYDDDHFLRTANVHRGRLPAGVR